MRNFCFLFLIFTIIFQVSSFKPKLKPVKILSLAKKDVSFRWTLFKTKHNKIFKNFSHEVKR